MSLGLAAAATEQGVAALNEAGCFLAYEGDWAKGRKTGRGTAYDLSGETYTGALGGGGLQTGRLGGGWAPP